MDIKSYNGNYWTYVPEENALRPGKVEATLATKSSFLQRVIVPYTKDSLQKLCADHLNELILSLTENCNMRCKYCTYCDTFLHARNFSSKTMSLETGMAAIKWLERHSRKSPTVNISFFGGEPLLEVDLLQHLYDYAMSLFKGRTLTFMVSTNGTLFNEEFLLWLKKVDNLDVTITLNGPAEVHDKLRIYKGGGRTHKKIIEALPALLEALKQNRKRLIIQCNYRDQRDIITEYEYFSKNPLLNGIKVFYAKISMPINPAVKNEVNALPEYVDGFFEKKIRIQATKLASMHGILSPITLWDTSLLPQIANSINQSVPHLIIGHQGCCSPLFSRINVDVSGNIFLCEKSDNIPILGNVNHKGIEWDKLDNLIEDCNRLFENLSCKNCPTVFYCQLCYNHFYEDGAIKTVDSIKKSCHRMCRSFFNDLAWYCSLMESCPEIKISPIQNPQKNYLIELTRKSALLAIQSVL